MPTSSELNSYIRRTGLLSVPHLSAGSKGGGIRVPIVILDAQTVYGTLRFQVTPQDGRNTRLNGQRRLKELPASGVDCGAAWVNASRVELDGE